MKRMNHNIPAFASYNAHHVTQANIEKAIQKLSTDLWINLAAESALEVIHSSLQRMRELAVQAANDTQTSKDRAYIQAEIDKIKDEIDRIAEATQFCSTKRDCL